MHKQISSDFNQNLLLNALESRGARVSTINDKVYSVNHKDDQILVWDIQANYFAFSEAWIMGDKYFTKQLLTTHNIPVAVGEVFNQSMVKELANLIDTVGFPLTVKPTNRSHGDYVYPNIKTKNELNKIIETVWEKASVDGFCVVEKYIPGKEFRVLVDKHQHLAAVLREPASVTGDGKSTILQLIQTENYRRLNPRSNCLCDIKLDEVVFKYLIENKLDLSSVPKMSEKIYLRESTNVSKGGYCTNITKSVHQSVVALANKLRQILGNLPFVGFDLICEDISQNLSTQNYVVCEINPSPGLSMHELPAKGSSIKVSDWLAKIAIENNYD